ncbi:MAG: hypothetical protein ACXW25_00355 [Rhodospirillales bacterium]|jgi:endonuclease YncB( thermonuclease family)
MLRHTAFACLLLVGALAARSSSADLAGPATVIDGDTIVVAGERLQASNPAAVEKTFFRLCEPNYK